MLLTQVIDNPESLAGEIVAFANSEGGTLYLGVDAYGSVIGLDDADAAFQTLANICRDRCIPPISPTIESQMVAGKALIV